MWMHKESKWLVKGRRKVRCYLCGKKILKKDPFMFHENTGYYSHNFCIMEANTIDRNERRKAVKKIAVGAAVVGAMAAGAGKFIDISSQSKGSNSPDTQTILTSQGLILPALTSDPANPVAGQMWYRSDAGVTAHYDSIKNRVVYSSEINNGNVNVTSKGIINGLSVLPNDGTGGFGPDTTLGATSVGEIGSPYTKTAGILEAWNYAVSIGEYSLEGGGLLIPKIQMEEGVFVITGNATLTAPHVVLNMKINGISQGGTWIQLNFNSGYAFTVDPSIVAGSNVDMFSYTTVFNGSGYTAEGLLSIVIPSTDGNYQSSAFQSYSLNVSGGNTVYKLSGFGLVSLIAPELYYKTTFSISNCVSVNVIGGWSGVGGNYIYIDNCQFVAFSAFMGREVAVQLTGSSGQDMDVAFTNSSFWLQVGGEIHKISIVSCQIQDGPFTPLDRIGLISGQTSATIKNLYVLGDINAYGSSMDYLESGITVTNVITQFVDPLFSNIPYSNPDLPANPPVSGTVYQNTNPYDIEIDLPVYATTSGTAGYVTIAKGATSTPTAIGNQYVSGDTSSTATQIIRLSVPAGWYYSFTGSGVTFATATPFAE